MKKPKYLVTYQYSSSFFKFEREWEWCVDYYNDIKKAEVWIKGCKGSSDIKNVNLSSVLS